MITVTNISDIRKLPHDAFETIQGYLERSFSIPDGQTTAQFSHNVPCYQYAGIQETKHLFVLVNYGDQRWLDELAARFINHTLKMVTDEYDNMWVYIEKTGETYDWVSSRILHAVRMLSNEFAHARLREGNPPTTWKELFRVCFRYARIRFHLPWSTHYKYWGYIQEHLSDEERKGLAYYDAWIPKPNSFYYETLPYITDAIWKQYHQRASGAFPSSPFLIYNNMSYNTRLPACTIISEAIRCYQAAKQGGER